MARKFIKKKNKKLPDYITESKFIKNNFHHNKKIVNLPDNYRHFGYIELIKENCKFDDQKKINIIEIGSGTGYLAKYLFFELKNLKFFDIDFPEVLVFAYLHLSIEHPQLNAILLDEKNIKNINTLNYDLILCPVHLRNELFRLNLNIDLVINTASFGEMKRKSVIEYFDDIKNKIKPKYFFSANRFLNTIIPFQHDWRYSENGHALEFDSDWNIHYWELEPDFLRCPWDNFYARQLVIICSLRDNKISSKNLINDSNLLIHQVEKASWNIFKPEMTYIDNILVNDMTKTGILFKLWNSIRLNKNTKNLYLMLKYLETLIKDESKNFEEFFYYLNDLKSQKNLEKNHIELLNKYKTKYQHNEIKLLKSVGNYNLVKRGNKFLIVNQSLGIIDFINEKIGEREIPNYIEIFDTESEAIKSIEKK